VVRAADDRRARKLDDALMATRAIQLPTASGEPSGPFARRLRLPFDPWLALAAAGLGACSLVTLRAERSLHPGLVNRQAVYLALGALIMAVISRFDCSRLREVKWPIYAALLLILVVVLGVGHSTQGSVRAISFPLFSFQSSELGKVLLIVFLAALIVDRARHVGDRELTARVMLFALVPAMIVIAEPDLGSGLVYITIAFVVLFIGGTSWRHLAALAALGAIALTLVFAVAPALGLHPLSNQAGRITAFLNPSSDPNKPGYQQYEAGIAIGAGGRTGRGVAASQTSLGLVPEPTTDFIFAVVGERFGFAGAAVVLSLYALLIWRGLRILTLAKNLFGALIAAGVVAMLMFQVFVNVGVAVGILPITGVTLPLMSYGGSSVLTIFVALGLLQSVYAQGRATAGAKGRGLAF
jgi:rod shape determining protein RodA